MAWVSETPMSSSALQLSLANVRRWLATRILSITQLKAAVAEKIPVDVCALKVALCMMPSIGFRYEFVSSYQEC